MRTEAGSLVLRKLAWVKHTKASNLTNCNDAGTGEDFKDSMVKAIEEIVGSVHLENVAERRSKNGKYCSIKIMAYIENGSADLPLHEEGHKDEMLIKGVTCIQVRSFIACPLLLILVFHLQPSRASPVHQDQEDLC
eukprot:1145173-Pelagomonas_calceolata.AAC.3